MTAHDRCSARQVKKSATVHVLNSRLKIYPELLENQLTITA